MEGLQTILIFIGLTVPFFAGTVWGVVDALTKDFGSQATKITWVAVAAVPFVGFLIYLIGGFRKGTRSRQQ